MPVSRESAAQALGMHVREIVEVGSFVDYLGGHLVELVDGTFAVAHDDDTVTVRVAHLDRLSPASCAVNPRVRFVEAFPPRPEPTAAELIAAALDGLPGGAAPVLNTGGVIEGPPASSTLSADDGVVVSRDDVAAIVAEHGGAAAVLGAVAASTPPASVDEVPDGPAEVVLVWVGEDVERARLALAAEGDRARGPRAGLSRDLAALIGPAEGSGAE